MALFRLKGTQYTQTAYQFIPGKGGKLAWSLYHDTKIEHTNYSLSVFELHYTFQNHEKVFVLRPWEWILVDDDRYPFHIDTDDKFNEFYEVLEREDS